MAKFVYNFFVCCCEVQCPLPSIDDNNFFHLLSVTSQNKVKTSETQVWE